MELKAFIEAQWCPFQKRYKFQVNPFHFPDYILVKEVTLEVDTPDANELDAKTVEVLKAKLQKLKGDHYVEEQRIQKQIDEKLALEHVA